MGRIGGTFFAVLGVAITLSFIGTVPLPEMYNGDFSNFRNASNAIIPI